MRYVTGTPIQGAMYHQLVGQVAANHTGLGPQNVASRPYNLMIGHSFQKPLSGSTTSTSTVEGHPYR